MTVHRSGLVILVALSVLCSGYTAGACDVRATIETGSMCGVRKTYKDHTYAAFLNVPYAAQPVAELRFKELQPAEPWQGDYDASKQGPSCPQIDQLYGTLRKPHGTSEECIHANIYVPEGNLPGGKSCNDSSGVPILVFMHGGSFQAGSGDADVFGPEYFFDNGVIVITFNYRLNVFGFMSLNSASIPGNQGLRDALTLLKWVKTNAKAFGGDPDNVTLMGQSAGAASVHLLSLSKAAKGLFKRVVLSSGTGLSEFFSTQPAYAQLVANSLLTKLGITSTDSDEIHRQLIQMPLDTIMDAYSAIQDQTGLFSFVPVVETPFKGVTTVLDDDPEKLIKSGRGSDVPVIIGFDTLECATLAPRFEQLKILDLIEANPAALLWTKSSLTLPNDTLAEVAQKVSERYFKGSVTMDHFIKCCSDEFFVYPALKLSRLRAEAGGSTYLYQFSYKGQFNVFKAAFGLSYKGTGHLEDWTYVFRVNSILSSTNTLESKNDALMKDWMTAFISNFARCSNPTCSKADKTKWDVVKPGSLKYQDIATPNVYKYVTLTEDQKGLLHFFDSINGN